jgi:hypothetical protein|tara:strand:- start:157 stop:354 length:198 start_codon:yes stop_codon:yes gene_type:complete
MQQLRMTSDLEDAINVAWNEAEELDCSFQELDDIDLVECREALHKRAKLIMSALHNYAFYSVRTD